MITAKYPGYKVKIKNIRVENGSEGLGKNTYHFNLEIINLTHNLAYNCPNLKIDADSKQEFEHKIKILVIRSF